MLSRYLSFQAAPAAMPPRVELPSWLQVAHWIRRPYAFMDEQSKRLGNPFYVDLTIVPWRQQRYDLVLFNDPESIRALFTAGIDALSARESNRLLQPFLGENSLLLLEGDRHMRHRKLLLPPFHGARMRAYGELIAQITRRAAATWPLDRPFAAHPAMQEISFDVILRAVFGIEEGARFQRLKHILLERGAKVGTLFVFFPLLQRDLGEYSPGGQFHKFKQEARQILLQEIAERRVELAEEGGEAREDILSLLLQARDEDGQALSDDELHDQLLTLLVAGHETTASGLAWALNWIHSTPGVQQRLDAELESLPDDASADEYAKLPYLEAVCKEALRLCPIIPMVGRRVRQPFELKGYRFQPGTYLTACIYLVHQNPSIYPQPKLFRPERFLERKFSPYEYIPFGGGIRRCIGMAFALYEMKIVLATLTRRLRLRLPPGAEVAPVRRNITLVPRGRTRLIATRR